VAAALAGGAGGNYRGKGGGDSDMDGSVETSSRSLAALPHFPLSLDEAVVELREAEEEAETANRELEKVLKKLGLT
jgi:hypothetical protein